MFGLKPPVGYSTYPEYVTKWRQVMNEAYELTSAHAKKSAETGKQQYDKKVRHTALYEGDRALVRDINERGGPGKLRPYWEQQIYVATRKMKDIPVYEVKPENGDGRSRVLHCNLLLPCSYLPVERKPKPLKRSHRASRSTNRQVIPQEENEDEDVPSLTPNQLQELFGSTSYHEEDNAGFAAELPEQDVDMGGPAQSEAMLDDAVDGAPPRQSQRTSRPPLRMTYDTLQPCSTAGVQGIAVSHPQ